MKNGFILLLLLTANICCGQKYLSNKSTITFFSEAPLENITATNSKSTSAMNIETGKVAFSVPIKHFEFEKSLMQEHFNEQYLESHKFPKSTFVGSIEGFDRENKKKQAARAKGVLTIHGEEHEIDAEGFITINKNKIVLESTFMVKLVDYKIKVPQVVWQNIAEVIEVTVYFEYEPYE